MGPTLTFFCPACATRLTVPASMAGISGPCPVCRNTIQAPLLPAAAVPTIPISAPLPQPEPVAPAPHVPAPAAAIIAPQAPPATPAAVPVPSPLPAPADPTIVKVEPRNYRQRAVDAPEVVARPIGERYVPETTEYRHPGKQQSRVFFRLLISLLVILAMAGISFGLILYFREQPDLTKPGGFPKPLQILPDEEIPESPATIAAKPPAPAISSESAPDQPAKPSKVHPGIAATALLEKFLAASTLDERLPLIDTRLSRAELENSILAKPMPPNPRVAPDVQETNPADGSTDIFYNIDFKTDGGKDSPQTILVRARAEGNLKIIVDPFLDTFGGRLASYAATPSEKIGSFQVVISAVAQTTSDRNVPNHENKLRLKLMPRDNEKEIANAYFTKLSKIGEMLTTDGSGFRYGQARTARVILRWNREEDPANPFLEAMDIKEFRWNP